MKKFCLTILFLSVCCLLFSSGIRDNFIHTLNAMNINPYVIIFILAMTPISELRGSMLFAWGMKGEVNLFYAALISIVGNMIPIFFTLFIFPYFEKLFRKIPFFNSLMDKIFERIRSKSKEIEQYEELGLMVFVAIPSPFTGAWTGSLVAYLLNFSYLMSILYIFLGVVCAAILMTTMVYFGTWGLIIGITFLVLLSFAKGIWGHFKGKKKQKETA